MSKIYFLLKKSLFLSLFFLFFLVIKTTPALAAQTIGEFTIDHSPNPARLDSGSITFTITTTRDIFAIDGQKYSFTAWNDSQISKYACPGGTDTIKSTSDPRKITFSWIAGGSGCHADLGRWHFIMWLGNKTLGNTPESAILIPDYPFDLVQVGGGVLQIIPVKTPLGLSETPQVNLINARKGNTYTFWWDDGGIGGGAQTSSALRYPATTDGNVNNLNLEKVGADFTKPKLKTLCMEVGDYSHLIGVTCRYRASFDFQAVAPAPPPPTTKPDCSIQAANNPPVKDDSVSITVKNLPLTPQDYRAELIKGATTTGLLPSQNSGSLGIVTINLSPHLDEGNYTAKVYDANNQLVPGCSKDFTVGPAGAAAPVATVAPCTRDCSKAGAATCDEAGTRGPAIKTAIGCIHTNPAEFVKDFMKFIVGISGGLAFLMMLLGAFGMLTSAGNPDGLNAGKDRLTSGIIGLLFVIFAVLLLQIIGVGILDIPGFK